MTFRSDAMLRRTSFKRPVYERPPRPALVPVVGCRGVYSQASNEAVAVPKEIILRSEMYRRYVASHACFGCAISGYSQCAHDDYEKGMGLKVCDSRTFPLCAPRLGLIGCHQQFDLLIDMSLDERRELGARYVGRMQCIARADGWDMATLRRPA